MEFQYATEFKVFPEAFRYIDTTSIYVIFCTENQYLTTYLGAKLIRKNKKGMFL